MNAEKNYKNEVGKQLVAEDNFKKLSYELNLNEKKSHSKTGLWVGISSLAVSMGVLIPVLLLSSAKGGAGNEFTVGTVTTQEAQQAVKDVYSDSLDKAEEMDSFGGETSNSSNASKSIFNFKHKDEDVKEKLDDVIEENEPSAPTEEEIEDEEPSIDSEEENPGENEDQSTEEQGETQTSEETSEEVTEEAEAITSYHVDYKYNYSFIASMTDVEGNKEEILKDYDNETYTLDYQKEENNDPLIKFSLSHNQGFKWGVNGFERTGTSGVSGQYQDQIMYTTQSVNSHYSSSKHETVSERKIAYRVRHTQLFENFSDYFVSVSRNLRFVDDEIQNESYIGELLAAGNVEVTAVEGNNATIAFDYESGKAEITFDVINGRVNKAKYTLDKLANEAEETYTQAYGENVFSIDEFKYTVELEFTYNETEITKLTDEEIDEYHTISSKFDHYFDKLTETESKDRGYHGGRNNKKH